MSRDRVIRSLEICRQELRKARAASDRSTAYYWALQVRDNQLWLRRWQESEAQGTPGGALKGA